jgi:hypothetical protein
VREIVTLEPARRLPEIRMVAASLGVPVGAALPEGVRRQLDQAFELYVALADPRGVYVEVSAGEFLTVYRGEGHNAPRTPLALVLPGAERLALFAVTVGEPVSERIGELFAANEPALGYLLDAVASERADAAAELLGEHFRATLTARGLLSPAARVLPYSPGYCGWNITGQRRLFAALAPEEIGITLNESCLMQPLKSVSGVLVAGPGRAHEFDDDFEFCDECATRHCRDRIRAVTAGPDPS